MMIDLQTNPLKPTQHNTAPQADVPCAASISRAWYVIYTKPRQEYRAQENLQKQQFEVYLPVFQSQKMLRGKLLMQDEPLFKRYLFVRFDPTNCPWHVIRNTFGVSELVRFGGQLATVPADLINTLLLAETRREELFNRGESLRVTDGPFQNLEGIFEMQDGENRAIVLIDLLNKTQKITLNLKSLAKAT